MHGQMEDEEKILRLSIRLVTKQFKESDKFPISLEGCRPTVFLNLGETLLSCLYILKIADSDVVF